jgi:DNA repair protein RecO (recombination protein O)
MITKTDAVVLRSIHYRDQSKILTLYTKSYGRLSVIAKGVRSPQNKYASAFEVGSHITVVLYKKSSRDIQNISDASIITPYLNLTSSLDRLSAMHHVVELIRLCTEDEEQNHKIYTLLVSVLDKINDSKKNLTNIFFYFQVKLIAHLGFKPSFSECVISGKNIRRELEHATADLLLIPDLGGVALRKEALSHGHSGKVISVQAYRLIEYLSTASLNDLESLSVQPSALGEISLIMDVYFRFHIEDLPPLRSREVFNQVTQIGM